MSSTPEKPNPLIPAAIHLITDKELMGRVIVTEQGYKDFLVGKTGDIFVISGRKLIEVLRELNLEGIIYEIKQPIPRTYTPEQAQSWFPDPKPTQP